MIPVTNNVGVNSNPSSFGPLVPAAAASASSSGDQALSGVALVRLRAAFATDATSKASAAGSSSNSVHTFSTTKTETFQSGAAAAAGSGGGGAELNSSVTLKNLEKATASLHELETQSYQLEIELKNPKTSAARKAVISPLFTSLQHSIQLAISYEEECDIAHKRQLFFESLQDPSKVKAASKINRRQNKKPPKSTRSKGAAAASRLKVKLEMDDLPLGAAMASIPPKPESLNGSGSGAASSEPIPKVKKEVVEGEFPAYDPADFDGSKKPAVLVSKRITRSAKAKIATQNKSQG